MILQNPTNYLLMAHIPYNVCSVRIWVYSLIIGKEPCTIITIKISIYLM
jgi:hypothetical protein